MSEAMGYDLGVHIADRHFHLRLDRGSAGLHRPLSEKFEAHLAPPAPDALQIHVSTWTRRRSYTWQIDARETFAAHIKTTLHRLPQTHPVEQRFAKAMKILRHIDPQDITGRRGNGANNGANVPVFAMSGDNLFFGHPQTGTAHIFVKKTVRKAHMIAGVLNGTMFALSHGLLQSGGLLLHGCALERNGKTVLFLGGSGSGKTTAARLCRPDVCFADDGVVIVEKDHHFRVYPSPFRQIEAGGHLKNDYTAAVEKVILLEKDTRDRLSALDKHEMMLFILRHAIHFFKYLDDGSARKGFETAKRMLEGLPIYRLQFTPASDIWKLIYPSERRVDVEFKA
jgi:hypothetical protein